MQSGRSTKYFSKQRGQKKTNPIDKKEEVASNPDPKIDQDFPGFPHGNSKKEVIKPETKTEKKTAAVDKQDTDEQNSDGSANAFEGK